MNDRVLKRIVGTEICMIGYSKCMIGYPIAAPLMSAWLGHSNDPMGYSNYDRVLKRMVLNWIVGTQLCTIGYSKCMIGYPISAPLTFEWLGHSKGCIGYNNA